MLRKHLARLLAFVLVLNLVLCAPLSAGAEEGTQGVQPSSTPTITDENKDDLSILPDSGTLVVTDAASVSSSAGITADDEAGKQTVTVETPLVGTEIDKTDKEDVCEGFYESDDETIPFTEKDSYNLKAEITDIQKENNQVTDIEYDISLEGQAAVTENPTSGQSSTKYYYESNVDQWLNGGEPEDEQCEFTVNMSINGMKDDPTRVEHKYKSYTYTQGENGKPVKGTEEEHTEYYYNASTKTGTEADNGKKFFEVVQEAANKVVSLVTNFLGKFHITNDAFEDTKTHAMSTTLAEAVNGDNSSGSVTMLRHYTTDKTANITTKKDVTVDLNDKSYTSTVNDSAIWVRQGGQNVTVENGTINSAGDGIYTDNSGNKITVKNVTLNTNVGGGKNNYNMGIWDNGANNTIKVENSTIDSTGSYFGIYHCGNYGGATIQVIGSYVYADGETGQGIYVSGNSNLAKNTLTIKDSEIYGETGVEVKFTDATIDNSKLIGFGTPGSYTPNGNGSTTVGAALAVTDNNGDGVTGGTIVINSGYFKGASNFDSIYQAVAENTGDNKASIQLNGGRFVYPNGLYKYTDAKHAVVSSNDGSDYPYAVVEDDAVPSRPGYTFQGFKDDKGNAITLEEAIRTNAIAYAQWELIPEADTTEEAPAKTPAAEAPKDDALIIVEADSKGNSVDVAIQNSTAVVTVSTPAGEAAAVSEVTIPSVAELQKQGVDTVEIQVEKDVTLELDIANTQENGFGDTVKVTREEDILVISGEEKSEIVIHMTELKAAATEPVRIQYTKGVLTISLGTSAVYELDLKQTLTPGKTLTVKLEDGVLKLYDKDGTLIQEIKL